MAGLEDLIRHEDLLRKKISKQEENLGAQQQQLSQLQNTPQQTDLSPLMALTDAWTGSNMAQAYNQIKPKDNTLKAQALKNQLSQQEQGLIGDQIALLRLDESRKKQKKKSNDLFKEMPIKDQQRIRTDVSKSEDYKRMRSISDLQASTKKYRKLVEKHGFEFTGVNKKKIENTYADLKIKYKEAARLGALTGPDMALIEEGIAPSTGFKGLFGEVFTGGSEGVKESISGMEKTFRTDFDAAEQSLRNTYPIGSENQIEGLRSTYEKEANRDKKESNDELDALSKKYGL